MHSYSDLIYIYFSLDSTALYEHLWTFDHLFNFLGYFWNICFYLLIRKLSNCWIRGYFPVELSNSSESKLLLNCYRNDSSNNHNNIRVERGFMKLKVKNAEQMEYKVDSCKSKGYWFVNFPIWFQKVQNCYPYWLTIVSNIIVVVYLVTRVEPVLQCRKLMAAWGNQFTIQW